MSANLTYTLPGTVSAGAYLSTDGSDTLSWSSPSSFTGSLAGDVSGNQGATTVTKPQGQAVASTAPSPGQTLVWNGSAWSPQTPAAGSSTLPIVSQSNRKVRFDITLHIVGRRR